MTPRQTLDHLLKAQQLCYEVQAMSAGIGALLEMSQPTTKEDGVRVAHADTIAGIIDKHLSRVFVELEHIEVANTRAARGTDA